ncbi:hypothetical protein R3P38DRAFT_2806924 [Favolaschia claudopus]|uniref:Uncharacterized protein n=1 Tax=Favolaschia claudopus TaxID=2862362 RepID=A0AAV9ZJ65_9AGAR
MPIAETPLALLLLALVNTLRRLNMALNNSIWDLSPPLIGSLASSSFVRSEIPTFYLKLLPLTSINLKLTSPAKSKVKLVLAGQVSQERYTHSSLLFTHHHCSSVAPINRAIDDEGVQNYLKKQFVPLCCSDGNSDSIIDGRIAEYSVVLVLTQHDVIGSNADTASSKDAEIEELTNQLKTHKSQKKQPKDSKHSRLPETRKLRASLGIAMCQRQKELAQGRCLAVISALQHKYQSIYANVSGASAPPRPIPIFCVGSSDYLILHDHSPTKTAIFSSKSETGIPALYTHTMHIGERQGVSDAIHLLFLTYQLLNQSSITVEGDDEGSEIRLEKECEQEVASLVQSIEKMFAMIVDESSPLIDAAKQQSLHVFQAVAETHKWNQYLALMRRQGEFGSTNLNALLTSPIADSESLQRLWHVVFNEDIPRTVLHCMKVVPFHVF